MTKKATPKKKKPADDDAALWQSVTDDVMPLDARAKNVARDILNAMAEDAKPTPPPKMPAPQKRTSGTPAPSTPAPSTPAPAPPPPPELHHGTVAGLDKRTAERMKRGQLKTEGRLDLHGMTQDEARRALDAFVSAAHAAGKRQVLIITGKGERGGGVLKAAVPRWLNLAGVREKIVAFDYAQAKDGGEGALYVRLRKPRGESA